jgi:hypothetical protein
MPRNDLATGPSISAAIAIDDLRSGLDQDYRLSTGCSAGEPGLLEAGAGLLEV